MPRIALSIRAQLLLVLTVFLALPWLGYEYVRELERVLRDAQERTLAGTAQAVATALHDRPRLFATPPDPIASFARERAEERTGGGPSLPPSASPEIAQIVEGLSRTTARIWVIDRGGVVLARAGTLKPPAPQAPPESLWDRVVRASVGRLYRLVLEQPPEDFADDAAKEGAPRGRDVEGALAGILTTDRRRTSDGRAVIVSAAHPVWVGDQVRGVVVAEETGNAVLACRVLAEPWGRIIVWQPLRSFLAVFPCRPQQGGYWASAPRRETEIRFDEIRYLFFKNRHGLLAVIGELHLEPGAF